MARPSLFTQAKIDAICERLSKGDPLAAICRDDGMPSDGTVRDWMAAKPEVSAAIARAREAGEEWMLAECKEIADDSRNDYMANLAAGGDEKAGQFNGDHVQRCKLRIDTRLKLLAKWNPKKYGDRVMQELSGPDGGPIDMRANLADSELDDRIRGLMGTLNIVQKP